MNKELVETNRVASVTSKERLVDSAFSYLDSQERQGTVIIDAAMRSALQTLMHHLTLAHRETYAQISKKEKTARALPKEKRDKAVWVQKDLDALEGLPVETGLLWVGDEFTRRKGEEEHAQVSIESTKLWYLNHVVLGGLKTDVNYGPIRLSLIHRVSGSKNNSVWYLEISGSISKVFSGQNVRRLANFTWEDKKLEHSPYGAMSMLHYVVAKFLMRCAKRHAKFLGEQHKEALLKLVKKLQNNSEVTWTRVDVADAGDCGVRALRNLIMRSLVLMLDYRRVVQTDDVVMSKARAKARAKAKREHDPDDEERDEDLELEDDEVLRQARRVDLGMLFGVWPRFFFNEDYGQARPKSDSGLLQNGGTVTVSHLIAEVTSGDGNTEKADNRKPRYTLSFYCKDKEVKANGADKRSLGAEELKRLSQEIRIELQILPFAFEHPDFREHLRKCGIYDLIAKMQARAQERNDPRPVRTIDALRTLEGLRLLMGETTREFNECWQDIRHTLYGIGNLKTVFAPPSAEQMLAWVDNEMPSALQKHLDRKERSLAEKLDQKRAADDLRRLRTRMSKGAKELFTEVINYWVDLTTAEGKDPSALYPVIDVRHASVPGVQRDDLYCVLDVVADYFGVDMRVVSYFDLMDYREHVARSMFSGRDRYELAKLEQQRFRLNMQGENDEKLNVRIAQQTKRTVESARSRVTMVRKFLAALSHSSPEALKGYASEVRALGEDEVKRRLRRSGPEQLNAPQEKTRKVRFEDSDVQDAAVKKPKLPNF